ncbi:cellulase family glycosylhydrolase [Pseudoalteromonas luteoviolacea]|uniref:Glycosyl hydrolase family 5 n=1 Tax=Pseudoalteromonas luteoviolacea S4060-1 TaxID=1365257 RepID=A0A167J0S2_9GAMM|nr:cellulase family glycosylhydrolase [Pseudoalteromonas luteoviolacea]KZN60347.1 glycosyl hydrolase family 5 [Pseudoalteromonas luteoviolacea S4060-1]
MKSIYLSAISLAVGLGCSQVYALSCEGINAYPNWPQLDWQGKPSHANTDDKMQHDNKLYQANWWTKFEPGSNAAWQYLGRCSDGTQVSPIEKYGRLKVCGTGLCSEHNARIQLRGMSSHGLQWYGLGKCMTDVSLDVLAYDWQADIVRLSLYVQEGGYENDPAGFTAQMNTLIDKASQRGLYVLVDWHQLNPGDPNFNLDLAKQFFTDIVTSNKHRKNVIYDIANEPNKVEWPQIRHYAEQVIPVIRNIQPDALILLGTHGWSTFGASSGGSVQDVLNDPVKFDNIMYTFHFYAASHKDYYRTVLDQASDVLPVFVSEWGTQNYDGDGPNDFVSAQQYIDLMARKKISWTNWNYSDDFRSGAVFKRGACTNQNFTDSQLKEAGAWVKARIGEGR